MSPSRVDSHVSFAISGRRESMPPAPAITKPPLLKLFPVSEDDIHMPDTPLSIRPRIRRRDTDSFRDAITTYGYAVYRSFAFFPPQFPISGGRRRRQRCYDNH